MTTSRSIWKGKYIFSVCVFLAVILAVLYVNRDVISTQMTERKIQFTDPVSYYSRSDRTYLINNSGMEIMVLWEGKYQYSIDGGMAEDGFYSAREIVSDDEGNIYVLDKLLNDNGKNIDAERILKYNSKGRFDSIVYEYSHEDGSSVLQLYNLTYDDGNLQFVRTDPDNCFEVVTLSDDGEQKVKRITYSGIYENVWDFSVNGKDIYLSTKQGEIKVITDGKIQTLYTSLNTDDYYSIPTMIQTMDDGTVYYNDIGLRTISRISPDGTSEIVINAAEPIDEKPAAFNEIPIYTSFFVNENGDIYTIYADTVPAEDGSEVNEVIEYNLYEKSSDGELVFNGSAVEKSSGYIVRCYVDIILFIFLCLIVLYLAAALIFGLRRIKISGTTKIQATVILTAICVAAVSAYIIVNSNNITYYEEFMNKIANMAELISYDINENDINAISSPQDFRNDSYIRISDTVKRVLDSDLNKDRGMYCVIYKVQKDIVSAIYADDDMYGTGYPMPGAYEGSTEKEIYETGKGCSVYAHNSADGTYMFEITPVFGSDGKVIALLELGIDLYSFSENNRRQVVNILINLIAVVVIAVLLFTEYAEIVGVMKKRKSLSKGKLNAEMIRPIAFLLFFVSNMPTAFLPNFSKLLYDESFPISVEVAAALPVSAELFFASVTALCLGFVVARFGSKALCAAGAVMLSLGSLLCAFAPNLITLILVSCLTGIGDGLIMVAVNSYIAGYDEEEQRSRGFIGYNAALLAGLNCGTVIGSMIADQFGYQTTYIAAAVLGLLILPFTFICIASHRKVSERKSEKIGAKAVLRFTFKPQVIKYFVLIMMPYLICAAFLNYFFPLFGEENALTPTQISLAFLLMGVISIYAGPGLSKLTADKIGSKKSMLLASALYAFGFIIFILRPQVSTCYVTIALFAFADAFGYTSQSVYYSSLAEVREIGDGPAMGISNAMENIASTVGPLIFGAALMFGTIRGISLVTIGFIILAVIFALSSFEIRKSKVERLVSGND